MSIGELGTKVEPIASGVPEVTAMPVRVLIVDDSRTIRLIIRRCIEQTELDIEDILEAGNGQDALTVMADQDVHVVLTDINMPKMDGIRLLAEMKANERWRTVPVLMITTEAGTKAVLEAAKRGAAGYIRKPFTPAQIYEQLAPLIQGAKALQPQI